MLTVYFNAYLLIGDDDYQVVTWFFNALVAYFVLSVAQQQQQMRKSFIYM